MSFAKIRPRRGTKTEWQEFNPILMEGEWGIEYPDTGIGTGLCKFKFGNGFKKWSELPYAFSAENATSMDGGTVSTYNNLQLRRGTTDEWELADPILAAGEPVYDITKQALKIGDGEHSFRALDYVGYSWEMDNEYDFGDMNEGEIVPGPDDKDYDFGDMGGWGTDWSTDYTTDIYIEDPNDSDAGYSPLTSLSSLMNNSDSNLLRSSLVLNSESENLVNSLSTDTEEEENSDTVELNDENTEENNIENETDESIENNDSSKEENDIQDEDSIEEISDNSEEEIDESEDDSSSDEDSEESVDDDISDNSEDDSEDQIDESVDDSSSDEDSIEEEDSEEIDDSSSDEENTNDISDNSEDDDSDSVDDEL